MATPINYTAEFGEAFQRHILAVMCRVPGFAIRHRSALDHRFFADNTQRAIAFALLAHSDKDRTLPSRSTLVELVRPHVSGDDMKTVEAVVGKLFVENVADYAVVGTKAVEFGKQQAMVNAVLEAAERLDKGDRRIKPLIDKALQVGEDLLDLGVDYKEQAEERRRAYTDPEAVAPSIRTGIEHLDIVMHGGLGRGELAVVLGPPKRGKSSTLVNIGHGAVSDVSGYNVLHYSMEMNREKVVQRYDDRLMGARVAYKRTDPERYADEMVQLVKTLPGRLFVAAYPTRSKSVSDLRAHIMLLASHGFHPDLIIVDYADILKAERRLGEMRHEQAGIYEDLRGLAGEFDAAVWTGSQASKSSLEKESLTLGDFAETFEKAAIVDAAIAFCQTPDEVIDQRVRLVTIGLRNQEDGRVIECDIRRDRCLIRSIGIVDSGGTRIEKIGEAPSNEASVSKIRRDVGLTAPSQTTKKPSGGAQSARKVKRRSRDLPRREIEPGN